MTDISSILILTLVVSVLYFLVQRWWRHRQAAKLADKLLQEVVKGKDSFRR
ncbi:MAG: hypothetical protein MRJ96_01755 [Nitrospirales bacterium]|nr:hypothetical protein [Nitrospira sp.]MDR4500169.1 hypothetical protein [Nitrospirales bacterium]